MRVSDQRPALGSWRAAAGPLLVGTAAVGIAHWPTHPQAFWINAYWLVLLLAAAVTSAAVFWRGSPLVIAGEAVLTLIVVQTLWGVAFTDGTRPRPVVGARSGVSWTLAFTTQEQAIEKTFTRPDGWQIDATYVRIDLGRRYAGDAGFRVSANGQFVGVLSQSSTAESVMTQGVPAWSIRIPVAVLAASQAVRIEVRPTAIDRRLSIAGQGDPLIDRTHPGSSRFWDGQAWHTDRLDGGASRARGTYRIWLLRSWGELMPAAEIQALGSG